MYTITNVHLYPFPVNKKSGAFFPAIFLLFPVFAYSGPAPGFLCREFSQGQSFKTAYIFSTQYSEEPLCRSSEVIQ